MDENQYVLFGLFDATLERNLINIVRSDVEKIVILYFMTATPKKFREIAEICPPKFKCNPYTC